MRGGTNRLLGAAALTAIVTAGCADRTVTVSQPVAWGAAEKVVQAGNLYFAGQPDRQTLQIAREAGVETVVNLRLPAEMDWDEESAVRELGLEYLNIPVSRSGPGFDPATIESLHRVVADNPDRKILLHCSSGNRVSAWYALYLVEKKGYWLEEALPIAEQTGLTQTALVERLREYLGET